mgnify:CR=1 FL=1
MHGYKAVLIVTKDGYKPVKDDSPALPSTIISALHLDSQERLTAAEWREVARLVREEIKPLKEQRAERLANLRKEE